MQEPLEKALAELALGPGFSADDDAAREAWLARHGLSAEDADYLRATGLRRLFTYRRLVRDNLREALNATLPRMVARLDSTFDEYFERFLAERAPRTHYLRDVANEFLEFCAPLWVADRRVAPYLLELGDHEALQIEIASLRARPKSHSPAELELDAGVQFIDACRIVFYEHRIHELSDDETDRSKPRREPTWLLVYRSPDHEVRTLELTPLAAGILTRLIELRETLRQAVLNACRERKTPLTPEVLQGTAQLLADLAERGALFGRSG